MKQAAAITRASRQARNAMYDLDKQGVDALLLLYEHAAQDVRERIAAAADASNTVPANRLRELLRQIEDVIDALAVRRNAYLAQAIDQAAALGVRPLTAQGVLAVGGTEAVLTSSAATRIAEQAVSFVTAFTQADGLTLSDRLWRLDRGAKEALTRAIGQAVVQGQSAAQAAQEFIAGGSAVPTAVAQRLAAARAPALATAVDFLTDPAGGGYYQAERVFRTEINRAHGEAFAAAAESTPGFAGLRYLLSPRHPKPDICDLLSTQNLHGLGEGVYPTRAETPWPAHPNTLSFLEIVFADEVTDADRAAKETSLEALARLPLDKREGALGVTKAAYFDQGLLRTGMIRSPLRAVKQRLGRQGIGQGVKDGPHRDALPQYAQAVIAPAKLVNYALNTEHKVGGNKARVIARALGFTQANADDFARAILAGLPTAPAKLKAADKWGQRFEVNMRITGPAGSANLRTGWIIESGTNGPPLLTSAYVKETKAKP